MVFLLDEVRGWIPRRGRGCVRSGGGCVGGRGSRLGPPPSGRRREQCPAWPPWWRWAAWRCTWSCGGRRPPLAWRPSPPQVTWPILWRPSLFTEGSQLCVCCLTTAWAAAISKPYRLSSRHLRGLAPSKISIASTAHTVAKRRGYALKYYDVWILILLV